MKRAGQVAEVADDPAQADQPEAAERERELRDMWLSKDVFYAMVLAVILFATIWVGVSSGIDYVHVGRSTCAFSHDRFSQMDLKCGTDPTSNSGDPSGNTGATSGNTGVPLTNTGASIQNPPG